MNPGAVTGTGPGTARCMSSYVTIPAAQYLRDATVDANRQDNTFCGGFLGKDATRTSLPITSRTLLSFLRTKYLDLNFNQLFIVLIGLISFISEWFYAVVLYCIYFRFTFEYKCTVLFKCFNKSYFYYTVGFKVAVSKDF